MLVKTDLQIRNFQWSDIPAIVELMNYCSEYDQIEGRTSLEELENEFRSPMFNPEQEWLMVYTPENKLIACVWAEKSTAPNRAWGGGEVHPDYRRQGLGSYLLRTADQGYLDRIKDEIEAETPIYVQRWTHSTKESAIALFEHEGYNRVRTFYTMRIALDEPLEPVAMPEGFTIKPFNPETDAFKVYQAQQEAFRDHWGYAGDFPWDDWQLRLTDPHFDAGLWYIAYEGDEVAGVSLCAPWGEDIPELAWVNNLGTRKAYRKRGLATALLKYSFYEFQKRGYKLAGLGVDAANPTGALELYQRAGMFVHKVGYSYRKVLRGNPELIKD